MELNRFRRVKVRERVLFPEGLYGFEADRDWVLLGGEELPFLRLVGRVTFMVVDPFLLCEEYDPRVTKRDVEGLGEELFLLSVVKVRVGELFVNLAAPLVVGWQKKVGKQLLLANEPTAYRVGFERFGKFRD